MYHLYSDYAPNEALDRYSDTGLDDADVSEATLGQRRAAEIQMARRDRMEKTGRGGRAARRSHAPRFLESDDDGMEDDADDEGLVKMKARTRRQYDERRDMDDLEGVEDVSDLSDLKTVDTIVKGLNYRNFHLSNSATLKLNLLLSGSRTNAFGGPSSSISANF